jgi:uroporphyrin-III C-methyltransferase
MQSNSNNLKFDDQAKAIKSGVYLIGAGPGASDLITVRGARILAKADIVFYDALIDLSILDWCNSTNLVQVGKRCGFHSSSQRFINKQIIDAAQKYDVVVRLKGGDPLVFGRAQEEIDALEAVGAYFEIVPGITTALAASAQLKQPPTSRSLSRTLTLTTLPGRVTHPDYKTAIYYMSRETLPEVSADLLSQGFDESTPVCLMKSVSLQSESTYVCSLKDLQFGDINHYFADKQPVIVLVGEVYRKKLMTEKSFIYPDITHEVFQKVS